MWWWNCVSKKVFEEEDIENKMIYYRPKGGGTKKKVKGAERYWVFQKGVGEGGIDWLWRRFKEGARKASIYNCSRKETPKEGKLDRNSSSG